VTQVISYLVQGEIGRTKHRGR